MRTACHDLPASSYPFTVELLDAETREVRWTAEVTGPGGLRVPGNAETNERRPVSVRITFADGEIVTMNPEDMR